MDEIDKRIKDNNRDNNMLCGHRARMKQRLLYSDDNGDFYDYELLEILLFFVIPRVDVRAMSKNIINSCGGFSKIFGYNVEYLRSICKLNDNTIVLLKCVKSLMNKILSTNISEKPVINNWKKVLDYLKVSIGCYSTECYRILYLNKKYILMLDTLSDNGTVDKIVVYAKEVVKKALCMGASNIIISHNHPSGDIRPSDADIRITRHIKYLAEIFDINLVDHIIVSTDSHFSFRDNALL